jgi:hypothetical protein
MHGSDRVPDLQLIESEPWLDTALFLIERNGALFGVHGVVRFYEKVIKVKADVAALLILFSPTSTTLRPVAWRTVKGAVFWRSSRPLTALHATS